MLITNNGSLLRELREAKGVTQEEISALTGISQSSISQAEKGVKQLRPQNVLAYCKALRVPLGVYYILCIDKKDMPRKEQKKIIELQELFRKRYITLSNKS